MPDIWNTIQILAVTTKFLEEKGFENPRLEAELLLCGVLRLKRVELYLRYDRPLTPAEVELYRDYIRRRMLREPIQYIIGQTEFMGLPIRVNPDVLIPRPETELLVEFLIERRDKYKNRPVHIWDVGTGSGCLAIALAHFWPEAEISASDISEAALATAAENARLNQKSNIRFFQHDFLNGSRPDFNPEYSILISNPPYIALTEMSGLEKQVRDFEPHLALTDQADGLRFYTHIFEQLSCAPPAFNEVLLEMSGTLHEEIIRRAGQIIGFHLQIENDLNEIPRLLHLEKR